MTTQTNFKKRCRVLMALLLTYSPPPPTKEVELPSPEEFGHNLVLQERTLKISRISIVLSSGAGGKHPHLHALIFTDKRADNFRKLFAKQMGIDVKKYPNCFKCQVAKTVNDYYPSKMYLFKNLQEPDGKMMRDDFKIETFRNDDEYADAFQSITRKELLSLLSKYINRMEHPETFDKTHFKEAWGHLCVLGYDLTSHARSANEIFGTLLMRYTANRVSVNLLKD